MKKLLNRISTPLVVAFFGAFVLISCETNPVAEPQNDILPSHFGIDIPNTISNDGAISGRVAGGRLADDVLQGNDIYQHLESFIHIGEGASEIVEDIIISIRKNEINRVISLSYESDEDNRVKNLVVVAEPSFNNETYEYGLTITDALSEGNEDGGYAMQIYWNQNPVKGVALLKPYNIDRLHDADAGEAKFMIEYDSESDLGYDAHMIVSIVDLPLEEPEINKFSMRALKMFVGKTGNVIDVFGNSNHPNASFFTDDSGFNWAFVASGYEDIDLGIAEVGLPPSNLDNNTREVLLGTYSIKNVFTEQIYLAYPNVSQDLVDLYLMNTEGPGYFTDEGFIAGGTPPSGLWTDLETRILELTPYNPAEITNLQVIFQ